MSVIEIHKEDSTLARFEQVNWRKLKKIVTYYHFEALSTDYAVMTFSFIGPQLLITGTSVSVHIDISTLINLLKSNFKMATRSFEKFLYERCLPNKVFL